MNALEKRLAKLEQHAKAAAGIGRVVRVRVDPRKGQTEDGQIAAWRTANPDAASDDILWIVRSLVAPSQVQR